jgi:hypothetical protein
VSRVVLRPPQPRHTKAAEPHFKCATAADISGSLYNQQRAGDSRHLCTGAGINREPNSALSGKMHRVVAATLPLPRVAENNIRI